MNALVEEFCKLSFHSLRAKEKSFKAEIDMQLDNYLQKINLVPQEIGRVFLNIFNNAFYSVFEKSKQQGDNYIPQVNVRSGLRDGRIEIVIRDNGLGIPQKIIEKIFQPFFTTKPTGQGTGLGLSLSYDIIHKGHNGEILVETAEGEYAQFTILLPAWHHYLSCFGRTSVRSIRLGQQ